MFLVAVGSRVRHNPALERRRKSSLDTVSNTGFVLCRTITNRPLLSSARTARFASRSEETSIEFRSPGFPRENLAVELGHGTLIVVRFSQPPGPSSPAEFSHLTHAAGTPQAAAIPPTAISCSRIGSVFECLELLLSLWMCHGYHDGMENLYESRHDERFMIIFTV